MSDPAAAPRDELQRAASIAALVAGVVTLVVGVVNIGRSFNYDEAVTYAHFIRGGSIRRALTTQLVFNNHPTFSAIQAAIWRVGLVGETSQRLVPVACGAVTVGALVWAVSRRVGVVGGACAGVFLSMNPMYLYEFRSLRGYSLATMCALLAALATRRSWHDHRVRWLVLQAVAMVIAVTTHTYAALPILMIAIVTIALGQLRLQHVVTWTVAAGTALVIQLPLLDDIRDESRKAGTLYQADFPRTLVESLLGRQPIVMWAAAILGALGLITIARRSRRHLVAITSCVVVVVLAVLLLWQVFQPIFLYPRFFISLMPFVAALVGVGVSAIPHRAGLAVVVAMALLMAPEARRTLTDHPSIRDAARVATEARAAGLEVCGSRLVPLTAYTPSVPPADPNDGFGECDLFISLGASPDLRAAASARFAAHHDYPTNSITVWGDPGDLERFGVPAEP